MNSQTLLVFFAILAFQWNCAYCSVLPGISACPTNWTNTGTGCATVFVQPTPFLSAVDARSTCLQNGGDLASIASTSVQQTIVGLMENQTQTKSMLYAVYIGLNDLKTPGNFTWFDNSIVSYNNLSNSTASMHFIPGDVRCVAINSTDGMWSSSGANVSWIVVPCCFQIYGIQAVACTTPYATTTNTPPTTAAMTSATTTAATTTSVTTGTTTSTTTTSMTNALQAYCFGVCPPGWYLSGSTCYEVMSAHRMLNSSEDARSQCLNQGGDLLSVNNSTVDILMSYIINAAATKQGVSNSMISFYIGTNNIANVNSYVYLDKTLATYFSWNANPSNAGPNATCVKASWTPGFDGTLWNNVTCCSPANISWLACQKPQMSSVSILQSQDILATLCLPNVSSCLSNPCQNNATCHSGYYSYNCTCALGFTGVNCETEINYCSSKPCQNGGTCMQNIGSYSCQCLSYTSGINCETITNYCHSNPCYNNATCASTSSSYTCTCLNETTGPNCETNIACNNVQCNAGKCVSTVEGSSMVGVCSCPPSLTGANCETAITCQIQSPGNATLNESVNVNSWGVGSIMTYCCIPRFRFADMNQCDTIVCASSGWNATLSECTPHCNMVPTVANAAVGNANSEVGNTVNFTCNTGFMMPGNGTMINTTCLATGNWTNDLTNVSCNIIHCSVLTLWSHQTLDTMNTTYNTTVTFWCDVGYTLYDGTTARTIQCLADGTWMADLPPCLPVVCPVIPLTPNLNTNTSNNTYMTYADYSCDNGYRLLDGSTYKIILCDAGSEWSDTISDCQTDRCFPLPYVANATPSSTEANYWNQSTLTCIVGHRFFINGQESDQQIMTCQQNGWWYPILTACTPILCPAVPNAANNIQNTNNTLFGTIVTYTCLLGYYINPSILLNQFQMECLDSGQGNGVWNNSNVPNCWPIQCNPPPAAPINGSVTLPNVPYNYSVLVNYQCDPGTKFLDGRTVKNLECDQFGDWNESDVSCKSDRCNPVNITAHATPDTTNTSWYVNVTYHCNTGYQWPNNRTSYTLMCMAGGEWNDSFSEANDCQIKYCPPVEMMPNATTNATSSAYNTIADYECNTGFLYSDNTSSKTIWCSGDAVWIPKVTPVCQIIHCPALTDVENATYNSNNTYYDMDVIYSCLVGYQYPDKTKQKTVTCQANGTWTELPPPCQVVYCPPLPIWTAAEFNSTDNNFLSTVSYTCQSGYAFTAYKNNPGNGTTLASTCEQNKQWYPTIQSCVALAAINAALIGKSYESPQGLPIGTVACTILCVVLALIILLDLGKIYTDLKMMGNNVSSLYRHNKQKKRNQVARNPRAN